MNAIIYETKKQGGALLARASLTNETCESRYGLPVLVIEDEHGDTQAYGWGDILPSGLTGAGFVRLVAQDRPENHAPESAERTAALAAALTNIEAMGL